MGYLAQPEPETSSSGSASGSYTTGAFFIPQAGSDGHITGSWLPDSGVTPNTYTLATVVVDRRGIVINASNGTAVDEKVKVDGSDTTADYLFAKLTGSGISVTVLNPGGNEVILLSGSSGGSPGHSIQAPSGTTLPTRSILAFETANFSGSDTGNASLVALKPTGTAGTAAQPVSVTVDQWGRVTSLTAGQLVTQSFVVQVNAPLTGGGILTGSGPLIIRLTGSYYNTVQAPSGTTLVQRPIIAFEAANFSGSDGGGASVVSLKPTGTAGTATQPVSVTVDQWGRVTSLTAGQLVTQSFSVQVNAPLVGGGILTGSGPLVIALTASYYNVVQSPSGTNLPERQRLAFQTANFSGTDVGGASLISLTTTGTAGSFTNSNITVDQWGRVTTASNGTSSSASRPIFFYKTADRAAVNGFTTSAGDFTLGWEFFLVNDGGGVFTGWKFSYSSIYGAGVNFKFSIWNVNTATLLNSVNYTSVAGATGPITVSTTGSITLAKNTVYAIGSYNNAHYEIYNESGIIGPSTSGYLTGDLYLKRAVFAAGDARPTSANTNGNYNAVEPIIISA